MAVENLRDEIEHRMAIAKSVHDARLAGPFHHNLSAAARSAGISPSYLHKIESAEVRASPGTLARLCCTIGYPLADIRPHVPALNEAADLLRTWGYKVEAPAH